MTPPPSVFHPDIEAALERVNARAERLAAGEGLYDAQVTDLRAVFDEAFAGLDDHLPSAPAVVRALVAADRRVSLLGVLMRRVIDTNGASQAARVAFRAWGDTLMAANVALSLLERDLRDV